MIKGSKAPSQQTLLGSTFLCLSSDIGSLMMQDFKCKPWNRIPQKYTTCVFSSKARVMQEIVISCF